MSSCICKEPIVSREYPFSVITRLATSVTYADSPSSSFCAKALQSVVLPVDYTSSKSVRIIILSAKILRMAQGHRLKLNAQLSLPFVWWWSRTRGDSMGIRSQLKKEIHTDRRPNAFIISIPSISLFFHFNHCCHEDFYSKSSRCYR